MNARHGKQALGAALLILLAGGVVGCGYSTKSLYPDQYKTIAIPAWQRGREVYRRDWELRLTEALKKAVADYMTGYTVVDRSKADTILTGKIVKISRQTLSRNPDTGLAREEQITIELAFEWVEMRTGKVIKKVDSFPVTGTRVALHGGNLDTDPVVGSDFFQGAEATIDTAARLVVEQLQSPWGQE
jgi:hypothetical protein